MLVSDDALLYTIKFALAETMATDASAVCVAAGLPEDTIGRTYDNAGHTYTVIDAVPAVNGTKIRVQREDGTIMKISSDTLFYRLGLVTEDDPAGEEAHDNQDPIDAAE
jgi:hypothetical protein